MLEEFEDTPQLCAALDRAGLRWSLHKAVSLTGELPPPARIEREWRLWVVGDRIAAFSLYREGRRVAYRPEIDPDALAFGEALVPSRPTHFASVHVLRTGTSARVGLLAQRVEQAVYILLRGVLDLAPTRQHRGERTHGRPSSIQAKHAPILRDGRGPSKSRALLSEVGAAVVRQSWCMRSC